MGLVAAVAPFEFGQTRGMAVMLNELIHQHCFITVYGKVVFHLPPESGVAFDVGCGVPEGQPALVSVLGAQVQGQYIKYQKPFFTILPGAGTKAKDWDSNGDSVLEWMLAKNATVLTLYPKAGEAQDVFGGVSTCKSSQGSESNTALLMAELQEATQHLQRYQQMLTQLINRIHETEMAVIRNI